MLRVLDLFSGIGGFSLGLENTGGFETVAFCEIEDYPRRVLAKNWPDVPIYKDIRKFHADGLGRIDLIVGGYPCQPFSFAGKRGGAEDDRHLWPEMYRIVVAVRPTWCVFENVPGHISMGLDEVLSDMEAAGYTCWTLVIPACAVDAPHRRDRVWIMGHCERQGLEGHAGDVEDRDQPGRNGTEAGGSTGAASLQLPVANAGSGRRGGEKKREIQQSGGTETERRSEALADAARKRIDGAGSTRSAGRRQHSDGCRWLPEPDVGRVANGIPRRVDRLKCLGNAVVPQIPEMIGKMILQAEKQE